MAHSVPQTDRFTVHWALSSRWYGWLGRAASTALHSLARWVPIGTGNPELSVSREWVEEYERRSSKNPDNV